jgi:hypothetical protein
MSMRNWLRAGYSRHEQCCCPKKKRYLIHKDVICHYSEYFRSAYNGRWKESDEGVTLEDVEVKTFDVFVHWLYTQSLPVGNEDFKHIIDDEEEESEYGVGNGEWEYGLGLLKACTFGNRFLAPRFERITHNHYLDYLEECGRGVMYQQIIFAWENFGDDSSILDMMVEAQCLLWSGRDDTGEEERLRLDLPKEFLIRVMIRFAAIRDDSGRRTGTLEAARFYMLE